MALSEVEIEHYKAFDAFFEAIKTDSCLLKRFNNATGDFSSRVLAVAKEAGFNVSAEVFKKKEQLDEFASAVITDEELQEKLKAAGRDSGAFKAIAKEAGFNISTAEIEYAVSGLTEKELDLEYGGALFHSYI